ncbi:unnamed protein product [Ectocarpus sp. 4 AP-2014]
MLRARRNRRCSGTILVRLSVSGESSNCSTTSTCPPSCSISCCTSARRARAAPGILTRTGLTTWWDSDREERWLPSTRVTS